MPDEPFLDEPVCRRWAWADLRSMTAKLPCDVQFSLGKAGLQVVSLQRGEFCFSVRFLAERWHWTIAKVQRFLTYLKDHGLIQDKANTPQADLFDSLLDAPTTGVVIAKKTDTPYRYTMPSIYRVVEYESYGLGPSDTDTPYRYEDTKNILQTKIINSNLRTKNESLELVSKHDPEVQAVGELWNGREGLISHTPGSLKKMARKVQQALAAFGFEAVCLAITHYSSWVCNKNGLYRPAYRWTLGEFVSRQDGYNISRLSDQGWEQVCKSFEPNSPVAQEAASKARASELVRDTGQPAATPWDKWASKGHTGSG